jgi:hypothetical protein
MLGDFMLVFKRSKHLGDLRLRHGRQPRRSPRVVGLHRARARIASGREGVFFLSNAREVVLTNGSTVQTLSDRVKPLLLPDAQSSSHGQGRLPQRPLLPHARHDPGSYTLDFDTRLGAWFIHDYTPMAWVEWAPGTGEPALYASRPGRLEQAFTPTVKLDGADIFQAYWRGPFHTFNQSFVNKRVRRIAFDGSGFIRVALATDFRQTYSFQGRYDFQEDQRASGGQSAGVWGSGPGIWGGGLAEVSVAEILTPGVARAWSVEFGNNTEDPFIVDSYSFFINFRKDRSTA